MALNFLQKDNTIKEAEDKLGGGSFVLDTGIYDAVIDAAYMDISSGGAHNINFTFKTKDGKTITETIYVTSGAKKGTLNYYVDKNGEKQYLPGFTTANDISLLASGLELAELEPEDKMVEVYNPELKKKAPATRPVLMELIGKPIKLGLVKVREFKRAKDASGNYVDTPDIREFNEIAKVFHEDGQTVAEARADAPAEFITKWVDRNTADYVKDKTKGKTPNAGASSASTGATAPKKSLFNK